MPDQKSLRNLKLEIEYNGARYCGWQAQPNAKRKSIQEVIERAARKILREKIKLVVAGRTDAGVHALAQVAHFRTRSAIPPDKLKLGLNGLLPRDIKISSVSPARPDFHSRFSSRGKVYRYTVLNRDYSSPLWEGRVFFYPHPLDLKLMRQESRVLLGRHNFRSFQASLGRDKNPVKHIKRIAIVKRKGLLHIELEADGFLYNMVRNIVGTLLEVGRGRIARGRLKEILSLRDRRHPGQAVPACGLCLVKVKY